MLFLGPYLVLIVKDNLSNMCHSKISTLELECAEKGYFLLLQEISHKRISKKNIEAHSRSLIMGITFLVCIRLCLKFQR